METIAQRLKWLRKEHVKKTQEEVGKIVGVGKATIQKYENGIISSIPSDKIELLAEALETTPGFIMGWETDPDKFRLDTRFGDLLRKERLRSGLNKKEFSASIGITEDALDKYESGTAIPSINVAMPIAIQLGISVDQYDPVYKAKNDMNGNNLNAEIIKLLSSLSDSGRKQAVDYLRFLSTLEDK